MPKEPTNFQLSSRLQYVVLHAHPPKLTNSFSIDTNNPFPNSSKDTKTKSLAVQTLPLTTKRSGLRALLMNLAERFGGLLRELRVMSRKEEMEEKRGTKGVD